MFKPQDRLVITNLGKWKICLRVEFFRGKLLGQPMCYVSFATRGERDITWNTTTELAKKCKLISRKHCIANP